MRAKCISTELFLCSTARLVIEPNIYCCIRSIPWTKDSYPALILLLFETIHWKRCMLENNSMVRNMIRDIGQILGKNSQSLCKLNHAPCNKLTIRIANCSSFENSLWHQSENFIYLNITSRINDGCRLQFCCLKVKAEKTIYLILY